MAKTCVYVSRIHSMTSSANGCEECLAIGPLGASAPKAGAGMWAVAISLRTHTRPSTLISSHVRLSGRVSRGTSGDGVIPMSS